MNLKILLLPLSTNLCRRYQKGDVKNSSSFHSAIENTKLATRLTDGRTEEVSVVIESLEIITRTEFQVVLKNIILPNLKSIGNSLP